MCNILLVFLYEMLSLAVCHIETYSLDFPRIRITVISNEFFALLSSSSSSQHHKHRHVFTFWRLQELANVWRDLILVEDKQHIHEKQLQFTWDSLRENYSVVQSNRMMAMFLRSGLIEQKIQWEFLFFIYAFFAF